MRADRLISLILELQERGKTTASNLAGALGVSVITSYSIHYTKLYEG